MWGFDPLGVVRAPLLDALERVPGGPAPRPKSRPTRPDLIPSHPDLSAARHDAETIAEALEAWASAWASRPVVVDTHPGAHWTTDGAVQVADLVIVPVPPGRRELAATAAMLAEHERFPTLLVPTIVPPTPPAAWITALQELAEPDWVHLAPPISEHRWLRRRMLTSAVTLQRNPGAQTARAAREFEAVAHRTAQLWLSPITTS